MNVILCKIMSYYIYKICCDDYPDYVYVGSTKSFRQRKTQHKHDCNIGNTKKLYNTIRENGGWENWRMVILEDCGEITLTQARIKEEEHRVKLNANLNMIKCKGDKKEYDKEYYENNKEKISEYNKEYYEINKEEINKKVKCECGCEVQLKFLKGHKLTEKHKKLKN